MLGITTVDVAHDIREAIDSSDWFKAIVLLAIKLEHHGYLAIKSHLRSFNLDPKLIDRILNRVHLLEINEYLFAIGKIDAEEYRTIKKIIEERNRYMHRR